MFRNYVFRIHGESFSSRGCDNGRARSQDWHKRKEKEEEGELWCVEGIFSRRRLVHPLRKIKGAKMGRKEERKIIPHQASQHAVRDGENTTGSMSIPAYTLYTTRKNGLFGFFPGRIWARGPICMCQGQSASLCIFPPESRQPYPAFLFFSF